MGVIVFGMFPAIGHYNATFKLARDLQLRGHRILYIDEESNAFERVVTAQGFEFRRIIKESYAHSGDLSKETSFWRKLKANRKSIEIDHLAGHVMVGKLMKDLKPDLVLLDVNCLHYALLLHQYSVKVALLQTMMPLDKKVKVPPLSSLIVPSKSWMSVVQVEFAWQFYFIVRSLIQLRDWYKLKGLDAETVFKRVAQLNKFSLKETLNTRRAFFAGFKHIPELILSPREFDFRTQYHPNQYFIGPSVDFERRDEDADGDFHDFMKALDVRKKNSNISVVYCSLGSLSTDHYDRCEIFLRMVIDVVKRLDDIVLIMATGQEIDLAAHQAPNIHIFKKVSQVEVLRRATVMITHGGMNTINECIFSEVPVLVYPLNSLWDQNGNSARVVYHKIGMRGNIRKVTLLDLHKQLQALLKNETFRMNIRKLKEVILANSNFNKGVKIIEEHLLPETAKRNDAVHQSEAEIEFTKSLTEL